MLQPGSLCIPRGLQNPRSQILNGRVGEVRKVDMDGNWAEVCFDPRDPPSRWVTMAQRDLQTCDEITDSLSAPDPLAGCPCLQLHATDWRGRVSEALRIHEKVFLSCTNRFLHKALILSILDEINACKKKMQGSRCKTSDGKLLYMIAKWVLLPPRSEKVLHFAAGPEPLPTPTLVFDNEEEFMAIFVNSDNEDEIERLEEAHEQYQRYFKLMLKRHGVNKAWRLEAINGELCNEESNLKIAIDQRSPFFATYVREKKLNQRFEDGMLVVEAENGDYFGPIMVTAMHVAARLGDTSLCQLLARQGVAINANISIPNISQLQCTPHPFQWGLVTPMRLAQTFGAVSATAWFRNNGGDAGEARQDVHSIDPEDEDPYKFFNYREWRKHSCWTSSIGHEIYWESHGRGPNVLYKAEYSSLELQCTNLFDNDDNSVPDLSEQVIQASFHSEPCAAVDVMDTTVVDEMWAQQVERSISDLKASPGQAECPAEVQPELAWIEDASSVSQTDDVWNSQKRIDSIDTIEKIFVVKFSRSVKDLFPAKLHTGELLETVRASASQNGQACRLKSGASIFVYPGQHRSVTSVLKDYMLKPHHVVVSDAFLPLIYEEVSKIPSKSNIKPIGLSMFAYVDDEQFEQICTIEHTFINSQPRQLCDARSVSQSTSEVHRSMNIRRLVV